jgi:putative transcriptional regulator
MPSDHKRQQPLASLVIRTSLLRHSPPAALHTHWRIAKNIGMESLQGQFIVASTKLADPNFFRTVVLIVRHNEEGAMGMVVNRPASLTVREVWEKVSQSDCESKEHIHLGGPCPGPLMALHGRIDLADLEVRSGIYFTADPQSIAQLVGQTHTTVRFFAGYAGWGPEQLEKEISAGAWVVAPASDEEIFAVDNSLWERLITGQRREAGWLADALGIRHIPPEPSMN